MNIMKTIFNKRNIFVALVFIWVIFSVIYIIRDQWQDYKIRELQQAYQSGAGDAVNTIIKEALQCKQVPLMSGETKINIIAIECLERQNGKDDN